MQHFPPAAPRPSSREPLVLVENVSKKFCRNLKKSLWYGMKDLGSELLGRKHGQHDGLRPSEFWAIKDVGFSLKRGECLGLIGQNGAGKTTLLRMLNGLLRPDQGQIAMRGQVGAIIALGAGFNPILTGRENVYINATVLGLRKEEIDSKFEEIVDFAELWDFIDTPVQSYSSGMLVRLGFSIATAIRPDVLLLDEILAVGDLEFRIKCYRRIDEMREHAAIIFVSHSLEHLGRLCTKTLVLKRGKPLFYGDVAQGLNHYVGSLYSGRSSAVNKVFSPLERVVVNIDKPRIVHGESVILRFQIQSSKNIEALFRLIFFEHPSRAVAGEANAMSLGLAPVKIGTGAACFSVKIPSLHLKAGRYSIGYNLLDLNKKLLSVGEGGLFLETTGSALGEINYQIPAVLLPQD